MVAPHLIHLQLRVLSVFCVELVSGGAVLCFESDQDLPTVDAALALGAVQHWIEMAQGEMTTMMLPLSALVHLACKSCYSSDEQERISLIMKKTHVVLLLTVPAPASRCFWVS